MGWTLSYSSELIIEPTLGARMQPYLLFQPNVTANSRIPVTGSTISYSSELMAEPTLGKAGCCIITFLNLVKERSGQYLKSQDVNFQLYFQTVIWTGGHFFLIKIVF